MSHNSDIEIVIDSDDLEPVSVDYARELEVLKERIVYVERAMVVLREEHDDLERRHTGLLSAFRAVAHQAAEARRGRG